MLDLANPPIGGALLEEVRKSRKKTLTLLYASREAELNHAVALREGIERRVGQG